MVTHGARKEWGLSLKHKTKLCINNLIILGLDSFVITIKQTAIFVNSMYRFAIYDVNINLYHIVLLMVLFDDVSRLSGWKHGSMQRKKLLHIYPGFSLFFSFIVTIIPIHFLQRYGQKPSPAQISEAGNACPICQEELSNPVALRTCKVRKNIVSCFEHSDKVK